MFVGLPGLEPGKAGPESAVLPLHHSPMLRTSLRTFAAAKLHLFCELANLYAKKNLNNALFLVYPPLFSTFNFQLSTFIRTFAHN